MKIIGLTQEELKQHFNESVFGQISETADMLGLECYVVDGCVHDILLQRFSEDIDVVAVGGGITIAEALGKRLGRGVRVSAFESLDTTRVKYHGTEVGFVGARKESYQRDSRKLIVEDGTLEDDQNRRGSTINALTVRLSRERSGELVGPFGGMDGLKEKVIRTPLDLDITFSDNLSRVMRCIRFVTQLNFYVDDGTFELLCRNRERIEITSRGRIADELNKIILSPIPSRGFIDLDRSGLLALIFPELTALRGVETRNGRAHRDNFYHTLGMLDNINKVTDNLWSRWAVLLHDTARPVAKRWEPRAGQTFYNHNFAGEKVIPSVLRRTKLPMSEKMKCMQKMINLHMCPITIADDVVTDPAVRRLLFETGDDIGDLMTLYETDITSRNTERRQRFLNNLQLIRRELKDLEGRDHAHNFQPPMSGEEVMEVSNLGLCKEMRSLKNAIKDAILDGVIPNEYEAVYSFMLQKARKMGLNPVRNMDKQMQ